MNGISALFVGTSTGSEQIKVGSGALKNGLDVALDSTLKVLSKFELGVFFNGLS